MEAYQFMRGFARSLVPAFTRLNWPTVGLAAGSGFSIMPHDPHPTQQPRPRQTPRLEASRSLHIQRGSSAARSSLRGAFLALVSTKLGVIHVGQQSPDEI